MKIAIIGCGYTGSFLARKWAPNHFITATALHPSSLKQIHAPVQKNIVCKGTDLDTLQKILDENDLIVVTVGTHDLSDFNNTYLRTAQTIHSAALTINKPNYLIYTSNAIVYGEYHGMWVDEESTLKPITEQAKILIETEREFLSLKALGWNVAIIRLGQIYGPGREFAKRIKLLQEHVLPGLGDHYINTIHVEDVVEALDYVRTHNLHGIYNLTDDDHPIRKDFYEKVCKKAKLPLLQWNPSHSRLHNGNRRVSTHKIKSQGYTLLHPHTIIA
ncbi:MAG: NAD-dependent epimerase/dehydratase family protein [Parachlamydiales bacterium]|nr:NAD-dependent epimerase/dehydratase family protein [Parachlamydiales bacterium]